MPLPGLLICITLSAYIRGLFSTKSQFFPPHLRMLTSQNACQFSMFAFLFCCSLCIPEDETSYSNWPPKDYEFSIEDLRPSEDNLISIPLSGNSPPRFIVEGTDSEQSRLHQGGDKQKKSLINQAVFPSTLRQQGKMGVSQGDPLDFIINDLVHESLASSKLDSIYSQNNKRSKNIFQLFKDEDKLRDTRDDWQVKEPLPSSFIRLKEPQKLLQQEEENSYREPLKTIFMGGMQQLPSYYEDDDPLSKRIFVKKRLQTFPQATKRWWGNYYHPRRPQIDRRAAQSKHYGCLKKCIKTGKLHPIQCHTLC